jgi:peptidoglycan hydrolase CwlO-like protein
MKLCLIAILALFLMAPAFAENGAKQPSVEEVTTTANDTIVVLQQQRDTASDQVVQLRLQILKYERELAKARAEIEALKRAVY